MRNFCPSLLALLASAFFTTLPAAGTPAAPAEPAIMPWPAELTKAEGRVVLGDGFSVAVSGHADGRLLNGLARALRRLEERTGFEFKRDDRGDYFRSAGPDAVLRIECGAAGPAVPELGQDESYELTVRDGHIVLKAPLVVGVLHGLETLLQLTEYDPECWYVPAVMIRDRPRFPWRGLLIDVCRHWQPIEVIKRNLDGMAVVKLNVLHLHLTEDQAFRIESKRFPEMHQLGSDGRYFTQEQIREIIAYAADRGIRVMPEFDMPGHATSWLVARPEFGSQPEPQRYVFERNMDFTHPTLDPTNEKLYPFLDELLGEMAALFPDTFLHIGGDEVTGKHWAENPRVQAFIQKHDLKDKHGLQAYFTRRLEKIVTKHGKRMVGWDEILDPDLPINAVVQSWRGDKGVAEAAGTGRGVLSSYGYYIDLGESARQHYLVDPLPADTTLTRGQQSLVLGGEATMWCEWVTPETIDSRIWPRTAAIAERLWSPQDVKNVADMYRRLGHTDLRLEEAGLRQNRDRDASLRRLVGDRITKDEFTTLRRFCDLLEAVKRYRRFKLGKVATRYAPLTTLCDYAAFESVDARALTEQVRAFALTSPADRAAQALELRRLLADWRDLSLKTAVIAQGTTYRFRPIVPLAVSFGDMCVGALTALDALEANPRTLRLDQVADLARPIFPAETVLLGVENAGIRGLRLLNVVLKAELAGIKLTEPELDKLISDFENPLRW